MPHITLSCTENRLVISLLLSHPRTDIESASPIRVQALLDTGADKSMIQQGVAEQLNLPLVSVVPINSVESTNVYSVYMARVQVPLTTSLTYTFKETSVIGAPLPNAYPCLIGLDILSQGLLFYNGQDNTFTLSF